jgi:hypothetical protein
MHRQQFILLCHKIISSNSFIIYINNKRKIQPKFIKLYFIYKFSIILLYMNKEISAEIITRYSQR